MLIQFSPRMFRWLAAGFVLAALPAGADDEAGVVRLNRTKSAGVVRISDVQKQTVVRAQSPQGDIPTGDIVQVNQGVLQQSGVQTASCEHGTPLGQPCQSCQSNYANYGSVYGCPDNSGYIPPVCTTHPVIANCALGEWLHQVTAVYGGMAHAKAEQECREKSAWMRCKFGYFVPTGNCGKGAPLFGHYDMVYPVNPDYFDQRDGQVYAAQGYGGPVSVPLAPVVHHTYNYSWGVPSSRLTPISHPVPVVRQ